MHLIARTKEEDCNTVFNHLNGLYTRFNKEISIYVEPQLSKQDKIIYYYGEFLLSPQVVKYILDRGWKIIGNIHRTITDKDYYAALVIQANNCEETYTPDNIVSLFNMQTNKIVANQVFAIIYDIFTCPYRYSHNSDYCSGTWDRIIQVVELVTPLDTTDNIFLMDIEKLENELYYILNQIQELNILYTDFKLDNIGVTITGDIKLIDLESIFSYDPTYSTNISQQVNGIITELLDLSQ